MKTKLFLTLLLVTIFSTSIYSQETEDKENENNTTEKRKKTKITEKQQIFNNIVDYINCEANRYYLEHSRTNDERILYDEYKKNINCDARELKIKELSEFLKENKSTEKSIELFEAIENFKTKYKESFSKGEQIRLLSNLIKKDEIINRYLGKYMNDFHNQIQFKIITKFVDIENAKNETSSIVYLLGILLVGNILLSAFLFLKYTLLIKDQKKMPHSINNTIISESKNNNEKQNFQKEIDSLKKEVNKLKAELLEIKSLLKNKQQSEIKTVTTQFENTNDTVIDNEKVENKSNAKIFFMSAPNSDGTFDDYYREEERIEGKSIYIFEILDNKNTAKYQFIDDEKIHKIAFNSFESYIQNICVSDEAFDPHAKRILVKKGNEGIAEKKGDIWTVTKTMKINYV